MKNSPIIERGHIKVFVLVFFSFIWQFAQSQSYPELASQAEEKFNGYDMNAAIDLGNKAMLAAKRDSGENSLSYAKSMSDLGIFYYYNYETEKGIGLLRRSCALQKDLLGANDKLYLLSLSDLGSLYYLSEQYQSSLVIFQETSEGMKKLVGENDMDYAYELNKLGLAQSALGQNAEAELNFFRAIQIFESNNMKGELDYASLLNNMGSLYQNMNRPMASEMYYADAKDLFKKIEGKQGPNYVISLQNLGNLKAEMGQHELAKDYFEEVEKIKAELYGIDDPEYAKALNDLGSTARHLGQYIQSEQYYLQAIDIKREKLGTQHPSYHRSINNLAMLYKELGRYEEAMKLFRPTYEYYRENRMEDPVTFVDYTSNMSDLYRLKGELEEAEKLMNEALEEQEKISGKNAVDYALLAHNHAGLLSEMERFDQAANVQRDVVRILVSNRLENTEDFAIAMFQSGMIEMDRKQYNSAEVYLNNSLKFARNYYQKGNPELFNYIINLAQCYEKRGNLPAAEPLYLEVMIGYQDVLHSQLPYMSASEQSLFLEKLNLHVAFFKAFTLKRYERNPGIVAALYDIHVNMKDLTLSSSRNLNEQIAKKADPNLTKSYKEWIAMKNYLNQLYQLPMEELVRGGVNIDSLEELANQSEKQILVQINQKKKTKPELSRFKQVVKSLNEGELAIEMIRVPHYGDDNEQFKIQYAALILTDSITLSPNIAVFENGRSMDGEWSDDYFKNIFNKQLDTASYTRFWSELEPHLQGVNKLYLARDGIYNIMNVNSFYNNKTQSYLLDEIDIKILGSTIELGEIKEQVLPKDGHAHLFGYPDYYLDLQQGSNEKSLLASSDGRQFAKEFMWISDLPGTKKETEEIDAILRKNGWNSTLYLNEKASEKQVKSLSNPDILHLATHGYFDFENQDLKSKGHENARSAGALLRSGIMMAGSSNTLQLVSEDIPFMKDMEDGVLTGYEVTSLELSETKLVILSACLSGVGATKINGTESYNGMLRAFLEAGADNVVASCWSVDDEATMRLMQEFYKEMGLDQSIDQAFIKAQKTVKKEFPMPYYWGSFLLIQNP